MFTPEQVESSAELFTMDRKVRDMLRAYAATLRQAPAQGGVTVKEATPNDDAGHEWVIKHHLFVHEVDFGDEGKGRYVRLGDFNKVVTALEAALSAQQGQGEALSFKERVALEVGADESNEDDIIRHVAAWVKAAKSAPPAQPAERVPGGWVLVPREPTPEMLAAVAGMEISVRVAEDDTAEYPVPEDDCAEIYRTMITASPAPSPARGDGGEG